MTDLAALPNVLDLPASALGDAAAAALAGVAALRAEPADGSGAVPTDPLAVAARLHGGGRAVLVVSAQLAERSGPDAAAVVLAAVAAAAGAELDGPVEDVGPEAAVPRPGEAAVASALLDGDDLAAVVALVAPQPPTAAAAAAHEFAALPEDPSAPASGGLELLHDVNLGVTAELGRTSMLVRDVLALAPGSVIELDRAAGSPVDVLVNGTLIARGEVVVIDEEFGIRITEVLGYDDGRRR